MDAIKEQSQKPLVVGIVALIVGIILGLIYAWGINPVEWTDASIDMLRPDLQEDYMRMAIDSYALNQDIALAQKRYETVGENNAEILAQIVANPGAQSQSVTAFATAVTGAPVAGGEVTPAPATPEEAPPGRSLLGAGIVLFCLAALVLAGVLFYFFYWRNRSASQVPAPTSTYPSAPSQPEWSEYTGLGDEPPSTQFMATFKLGDDLFDDSFSIDSPAGEFLGECGVGISESVGVGVPKKVTAFEVWLFDKNDIQTVTKVLMSAHAFLDEATRQRLEAKGDPILAEPGSETILETQTLRLVARVVDMSYGDSGLPEQSFFDRLILELAVWPKS